MGELFSRYWRAARAAAFGVTGEFGSAEDAAAEAFQQALAGLDSLRDLDRFGPWLRTIVVRQARLVTQSRRRVTDAPAHELLSPNESPDDAFQRLELGVLIQQSARELPPRLREAVSLFYFEGYGTDDAAAFLGIPPGTFRRRLHEGRRELRRVAEEILKGSKKMNEEREREIERLKRLIDNADGGNTEPLYQALRQSMALRPPPNELIDLFMRHQPDKEMVRETARRFTGPSDRVSDPSHPVGALAFAIRQALPAFQEWSINFVEAAENIFSFKGEHRDRVQALLPPGFVEGRPGAFLRTTRALLLHRDNDSVRTTYQLLQDCADHETFRVGMSDARLSDVLDLTWMVEGALELRSVQNLLERLIADVLPGTPIRFSNYDEPRYRAALQLRLGDVSTPGAHGGVLAEWSGHPSGVTAAHLRIFLEPWATLRYGKPVQSSRLMEPLAARRKL